MSQHATLVVPLHVKDALSFAGGLGFLMANAPGVRLVVVVSDAEAVRRMAGGGAPKDGVRWLPDEGEHWPWRTRQGASEAMALDDERERALKRGVGFGWLYQQLLKLYADEAAAHFVTSDANRPDSAHVPPLDAALGDNVVWMDADVALARPTRFFSPSNHAFIPLQPPNSLGTAQHARYLRHRVQLLARMNTPRDDFDAVSGAQGCVCHHLPIPKGAAHALRACFTDPPLWKAFLAAAATMAPDELASGCASEYELMARFAHAHFPTVPRALTVADVRATSNGVPADVTTDADLVVSHEQWVDADDAALARRRSAADGTPDAGFASSAAGSAERARARRFV